MTQIYYMIGYDTTFWGGYETLNSARIEAFREKEKHPDKEITIMLVKVSETVVEVIK